MPVYLCKPGCTAYEPWRHGIQVYAFPFAIDSSSSSPSSDSHHDKSPETPGDHDDVRDQPQETLAAKSFSGVAVRRVRHAEVVLVDDVCIAHGRYWLRLRWPGPPGGFAGYIALGSVSLAFSVRHSENEINSTRPLRSQQSEVSDGVMTPQEETTAGYFALTATTVMDAIPHDASEPQKDNGLRCVRTGLYYPSSSAMKMMALYDDGLLETQTGNEPVFCRICREGLHDVENDETPAVAADEQAGPEQVPTTRGNVHVTASPQEHDNDDNDIQLSDPTAPELPPPQYTANNYATDNPLLAPCECSGSMAFVHYLCVEQWRCRSRHPDARNGLFCETCNSPYALPPPTSRPSPTQIPHQMEEDWLEAMPAHVLAALRQPHFFWQAGAAVVRRRWLRPIAPILISPLVALYCRARRLLKKRGVSRRRWACSLCRRRARWKCVRCLRSYYCSRQCQNVSWHIVHKHVCYKPARFWWSVVVYSIMTMLIFPGILMDPLIYDLGLTLIPTSFLVMGILGGGVATAFKKGLGIDMRGRTLEFVVVLLTLWLVSVSWSLVWAFFGFEENCHGVLSFTNQPSWLFGFLRRAVFEPAQWWFLLWDRLAHNSHPWVRWILCSQEDYCFAHVSRANADFYLEKKCASDLVLVIHLWLLSGVVLAISSVLKKRDRLRRARVRHHRHPGVPRPHQD